MAATIFIAMFLLFLSCKHVASPCKTLRCSSRYASAAERLPDVDPEKTIAYCEALRSYSVCLQKRTNACHGNLGYHSVVHFVDNLMVRSNCSRKGAISPPSSPALATMRHLQICDYEKSFARKHGGPPMYHYCAVFGDPHVRTFRGKFYTCRVDGSWPLLDNNYLFVQATSYPVVEELSAHERSATAIGKLTIIFKKMEERLGEKIYHAEVDNLPVAFTDGSLNGSCLTIHEHTPGRHVEIQAAYIGTTIMVRQVGKHLSFSVQIAKEVALSFTEEQDLQLCVDGCPPSQRISQSIHCCQNGDLTAQRAHLLCKESLAVEDAYFHACVFDVMTTGDAAFVLAAREALEDARLFHPDAGWLHIFHTNGIRRPYGSFLLVSVLVILLPHLLLFLDEY